MFALWLSFRLRDTCFIKLPWFGRLNTFGFVEVNWLPKGVSSATSGVSADYQFHFMSTHSSLQMEPCPNAVSKKRYHVNFIDESWSTMPLKAKLPYSSTVNLSWNTSETKCPYAGAPSPLSRPRANFNYATALVGWKENSRQVRFGPLTRARKGTENFDANSHFFSLFTQPAHNLYCLAIGR